MVRRQSFPGEVPKGILPTISASNGWTEEASSEGLRIVASACSVAGGSTVGGSGTFSSVLDCGCSAVEDSTPDVSRSGPTFVILVCSIAGASTVELPSTVLVFGTSG